MNSPYAISPSSSRAISPSREPIRSISPTGGTSSLSRSPISATRVSLGTRSRRRRADGTAAEGRRRESPSTAESERLSSETGHCRGSAPRSEGGTPLQSPPLQTSPALSPKSDEGRESSQGRTCGPFEIPLLDTTAMSPRGSSPTSLLASGQSVRLSVSDLENIDELLKEGISYLHAEEALGEAEAGDDDEWNLDARRGSGASTVAFCGTSSEWESIPGRAEDEANLSPQLSIDAGFQAKEYIESLESQCRELAALKDSQAQRLLLMQRVLQTAAWHLQSQKRQEEVLQAQITFAEGQLANWIARSKSTASGTPLPPAASREVHQLLQQLGFAYSNGILAAENKVLRQAQEQAETQRHRLVLQRERRRGRLRVVVRVNTHLLPPAQEPGPELTATPPSSQLSSTAAMSVGEAAKNSLLLQADILNHRLSVWNPSTHLSRVDCLAYKVMAVPNVLLLPAQSEDASGEFRVERAGSPEYPPRGRTRHTPSRAASTHSPADGKSRRSAAGQANLPSVLPTAPVVGPHAESASTTQVAGSGALASTTVYPPHLGSHNTADELFLSEVVPLADVVLDAGMDAVCIAMGQAGSGKSYTLFGVPPGAAAASPSSSSSAAPSAASGKGAARGRRANSHASTAESAESSAVRPLPGETPSEGIGLVERCLEYLFARLEEASEREALLLHIHAQWHGSPPPLLLDAPPQQQQQQQQPSEATTASFLEALQAQLPSPAPAPGVPGTAGLADGAADGKTIVEPPLRTRNRNAAKAPAPTPLSTRGRTATAGGSSPSSAPAPAAAPGPLSVSPREMSQAVLPDFEVSVSAYELYSDKVRDLLAPQSLVHTAEEWQVGPAQRTETHAHHPPRPGGAGTGTAAARLVNPSCDVKIKPNGEVEVAGLRRLAVGSVEEAMQQVLRAVQRRETAKDSCKAEADSCGARRSSSDAAGTPQEESLARYRRSRSHVVLQVHVTTRRRRWCGRPAGPLPPPPAPLPAKSPAPKHADPSVAGVRVHPPASPRELIRQYMQGATTAVLRSFDQLEDEEDGHEHRAGSVRVVTRESKLVFVDLAGMERLSTASTPSPEPAPAVSRERLKRAALNPNEEAEAASRLAEEQQLYLKETQFITRSTSGLVDVLAALAQRAANQGLDDSSSAGSSGGPHIPFRSSKLTAVLQNSLSHGAACVVIAHVLAKPCPLVAQQVLPALSSIGASAVEDASPYAHYPYLQLYSMSDSQGTVDSVRSSMMPRRAGGPSFSSPRSPAKGARSFHRVSAGSTAAPDAEEQWQEALRCCQERQEREIQGRLAALSGSDRDLSVSPGSQRSAPPVTRKAGNLSGTSHLNSSLAASGSALTHLRESSGTASTVPPPSHKRLQHFLRCPTSLGTYVTPKETLTTVNFIQRIPQRVNATMTECEDVA